MKEDYKSIIFNKKIPVTLLKVPTLIKPVKYSIIKTNHKKNHNLKVSKNLLIDYEFMKCDDTDGY